MPGIAPSSRPPARDEGEDVSFTNQKPFIVGDEELLGHWSGYRDGRTFHCGLCGVFFKLGDTVRWLYTNDTSGAGGNPLICSACDGPDVKQRWVAHCAEHNAPKFRFFGNPEHQKGNPHTEALMKAKRLSALKVET